MPLYAGARRSGHRMYLALSAAAKLNRGSSRVAAERHLLLLTVQAETRLEHHSSVPGHDPCSFCQRLVWMVAAISAGLL